MSQHQHARVFFTPEVQDEILTRIGGGESLLRICGPGRAPGMPDRVSVHRRLREDRDFRQAYLAARQAQVAHIAEEILEIADGRAPEAGQTPSVARDKVRIAARQWLAGVMAPRTYRGRQWDRDVRDELEEVEAQAQRADRKAEEKAREKAELAELMARIEREMVENGEDPDEDWD